MDEMKLNSVVVWSRKSIDSIFYQLDVVDLEIFEIIAT